MAPTATRDPSRPKTDTFANSGSNTNPRWENNSCASTRTTFPVNLGPVGAGSGLDRTEGGTVEGEGVGAGVSVKWFSLTFGVTAGVS